MVFDKYKVLREEAAAASARKALSRDRAAASEGSKAAPSPSEQVETATKRGAETKLLSAETIQNSLLPLDQDRQQIFLKGFAQVTGVSDNSSDTPALYDILSCNVAGVSPHARHPRRGKRKIGKNSKGYKFSFRMPFAVKAKLDAKAAATESYPSAYVLKLVATDLCLPIDEGRIARSRGVQEQIAALTVALNKEGALFNQIAAALNRGQPCPVTRQEIEAAWHRHMAATNAILRLGFD